MTRSLELLTVFGLAIVFGLAGFASTRFADSLFAASNEHRLIVGLATTDALVTKWWHPEGQSLDLIKTDKTSPTLNASVYWQSCHLSGSGTLTLTVVARPFGDSCKQTRVQVKAGTLILGTYWFKHIDNSLPLQTTWTAGTSGFTIRYVGSVAGGDNAGCPWDGIHLHQGGSSAGGLTQNTGLQSASVVNGAWDEWHAPNTKCRIPQTGDTNKYWTHRMLW